GALHAVQPRGAVRVRLTGTAAWQMGGRGLGRTDWNAVPCDCGLCSSGRFVAVDEPRHDPDPNQSPWRHLALASVHRVAGDGTLLTNAEKAFPPPHAYSEVQRAPARSVRKKR